MLHQCENNCTQKLYELSRDLHDPHYFLVGMVDCIPVVPHEAVPEVSKK